MNTPFAPDDSEKEECDPGDNRKQGEENCEFPSLAIVNAAGLRP